MDLVHTSAFYSDSPTKKLALCLFNRATYSRCKNLINELLRYPNIELDIYLSSSLLWETFGDAYKYIEKSHPKARFYKIPIEGPEFGHYAMAKQCGEITRLFAQAFEGKRPDAVILVADRFETLGAAISASYLNIPIIHLQGGEITGNIDDKVRHAVTQLSDFHFVSTELAKKYLLQMGVDMTRVFNTGCPSVDVIRRNRIKRSHPKEKYFFCIFHPDTESSDQAYEQTKVVMDAVFEYAMRFRHRCYWYLPNPDPGREKITEFLSTVMKENADLVVKAVNEPPEEFLWRLGGARLVIGNSSCGIRECSYLGIPAINIGNRQRYRERFYNVMDVGFERGSILEALETQHIAGRYPRSLLFGDGKAARAIALYIQRIELNLRGPMTYPLWPEFREAHFGARREEKIRKRTKLKDPVCTQSQ